MKKLLEYLAKSIVTKPDAVEINEEKSEGGFLLLKLKVDPEDMGLIIGKGGKIIRSIRNLVRIKAIREGARVHVELIEVPGYEKKEPEPEAEPKAKETTKETASEKEPTAAVEPPDAPEEPEESAIEGKKKKKKKAKVEKTEKEDSETSPEPETEVTEASK